LDLVLTIGDLYFKIVKSKIKKFSPATMSGFLADPLLISNVNSMKMKVIVWIRGGIGSVSDRTEPNGTEPKAVRFEIFK
jgi:hypothetical protein